MNKKNVLIFGALVLASVGVASAKSYSITLTAPTKVGATTLKAGTYEVEVKGADAVFTNADGKSVKAAVKVEQSDKKFGNTVVDTGTNAGADSIKEIDLGGSTTKLEFQ